MAPAGPRKPRDPRGKRADEARRDPALVPLAHLIILWVKQQDSTRKGDRDANGESR